MKSPVFNHVVTYSNGSFIWCISKVIIQTKNLYRINVMTIEWVCVHARVCVCVSFEFTIQKIEQVNFIMLLPGGFFIPFLQKYIEQ